MIYTYVYVYMYIYVHIHIGCMHDTIYVYNIYTYIYICVFLITPPFLILFDDFTPWFYPALQVVLDRLRSFQDGFFLWGPSQWRSTAFRVCPCVYMLIVIWPWVKTYVAIFGWMNIHLPSILMFTRVPRFWPMAIYIFIYIYIDHYTSLEYLWISEIYHDNIW